MLRILLFSFFVSFFSIPSVAADCGKITRVKGMVFVHRTEAGNIKVIRAKKKMPLQCDDVVVTEKKSKLQFKIGRVKSSIGGRSRIKVGRIAGRGDEPPVDRVNLLYGKVRSKTDSGVKEDASPVRFEIHTPTASAGIRGTDFIISYDPNEQVTKQATIEGEVTLTFLKTLQTQKVLPGQIITVYRPVPLTMNIARVGKKKKKPGKAFKKDEKSKSDIESEFDDLGFDED